jgi:SAM-dependent methyltransferase
LSASPFASVEDLRDEVRIESLPLDKRERRDLLQRRVRALGRHLKTLRLMVELAQIDFVGRFSTAAKVRAALRRYSPLHGGEAAVRELAQLSEKLKTADAPLLYRRLLRYSGRRPEDIVTWVRATTLHVASCPAVMRDGAVERCFTPLETVWTGIGQCTGFASLAAALIEAAGYEVRLLAVRGHTFLEWRNIAGRWQLEDVDVLPPGVRLPHGLSMHALLENYPEWRHLLAELPTLNGVPQALCFVPTEEGQLVCWRHIAGAPTEHIYMRHLQCGAVPRETRRVLIRRLDEPSAQLIVDNTSPSARVLIVCDRPLQVERRQLDEIGVQHDVFRYARARNIYADHFAQTGKRLFAYVPADAAAYPIPLGALAGCTASVFCVPADCVAAHPFLVAERIILPPLPAAAAESAASEPPSDPRLAALQQAFERALNAPEASPAAVRFARGSSPEIAVRVMRERRIPPFRGRVLDAGCGTGGFALALSLAADAVAAIDYTEERIAFLRLALAGLTPALGVYPALGSIERLPYANDAFDAVFCRTVIYSTDAPRVLREFHRVLKPGGQVYIDCNGDGWNQYLLLERGRTEPDVARQGRDTLYNAVWRRHSDAAIAGLRRSIERIGLRVDPAAAATSPHLLLDEMDRHLRGMPSAEAAATRRLELEARRLCGDDHFPTVLRDMLGAAAGIRSGPTVTLRSQSWEPEEIGALARAAGFADFRWWSEAGTPDLPGRRPLAIAPMLDDGRQSRRHFRGALTVWHCLFAKP